MELQFHIANSDDAADRRTELVPIQFSIIDVKSISQLVLRESTTNPNLFLPTPSQQEEEEFVSHTNQKYFSSRKAESPLVCTEELRVVRGGMKALRQDLF